MTNWILTNELIAPEINKPQIISIFTLIQCVASLKFIIICNLPVVNTRHAY